LELNVIVKDNDTTAQSMKIKNLLIFSFQAVLIVLTSCVNQKKIAYFQKRANEPDTIKLADIYVPKIQSGDILSVYISSLNPAASSFFNPLSASSSTGDISTGAISGAGQPSTTGLLVDAKGAVEIPIIGTIKVAGLTTVDARDTIKNRLKFWLKEPTVNVRYLNYKISILGEVTRPSVYIIPNERVTLPEALSMAGDLTIFAKRDNILVVRDSNGKKEFGRVDLNNRDVFTSPYYYLHSGDLVYVEQGKGKVAQTDVTYRVLPIAISALTLITLFIYRLK
jgi:polysaccharide export outer membrane protein